LFWPLLGWEFPKLELGDYIGYLLSNLLKYPDVYVPEMIGFVVCIAFVWYYRLYDPARIKAFIMRGSLENGRKDITEDKYGNKA
jgi:hypothetical protein